MHIYKQKLIIRKKYRMDANSMNLSLQFMNFYES